MKNISKKLTSESNSVEKKRKHSLKTKSAKNTPILYESKISKQSSNNKRNPGFFSGKKNYTNSQEINQKPISMLEYQEKKKLIDLEVLQKKYKREIADIIKFELDKQLLQFKLNIEQNELEKKLNNKNCKSLNDKMFLYLINKEKENKNNEIKGKSKISKEEHKSKERDSFPPKPLKIMNGTNFHENFYLMEQEKKQQLFEINEKKKQKRMENFEKLNKIKAEQNALKKRINEERTNQNLQRNYYELDARKNHISKHIQKMDLNVYENRLRISKKREEQLVKNKEAEKEKSQHIKKLRLNDEKNRISLYLDIIKKEKSLEKKKLENIEIKEKIFSQYNKLNMERNNNLKKLEKLIKNGIDEGNIEKFYSEFPDNKEISKIFENYQKEKIEIENNTVRNKKKLNPIKIILDDNSNDNMNQTYYDMKNKIVKIPKINFTEIKSNDKKDKENININKEYEKEKEKENQKKEKIINICSTNNKHENIENNNNENKNNLSKKEKKNEKLNSAESLFDESRHVLFETEIRDKIREYKKERYQPFIKLLEREKINEENRNQKLENIKDENEKSKLENQFGKERTIVSLRLKKENEKIILDIQNFEKNLRKENEKNQKYNLEKINREK